MSTRRRIGLSVALAVTSVAPALAVDSAAEITPRVLLDRSIAHHDPHGLWRTAIVELEITSTFSPALAGRRGYASRHDTLTVDVAGGRFIYRSVRHGDTIEVQLDGDRATASIGGSTDVPQELVERYRLQPERLPRLRDYHLYLYGLPMKLDDPGTLLDPVVRRTEYHGRDALALRVTYEPEVGGDTWYFYFDPESYALVGYRFYHDEAAGDGEYVLLDGEIVDPGGRLRLPRKRQWFTHQGDEYLGTDEIVGLEVRAR